MKLWELKAMAAIKKVAGMHRMLDIANCNNKFTNVLLFPVEPHILYSNALLHLISNTQQDYIKK